MKNRTPNPAQHRDDPAYLRALIERAQMSQVEVAAMIGLDARTFRRYVTGESRISYPVQFAVECVVDSMTAQRDAVDVSKLSNPQLLATYATACAQLNRATVASFAYKRLNDRVEKCRRVMRKRKIGEFAI